MGKSTRIAAVATLLAATMTAVPTATAQPAPPSPQPFLIPLPPALEAIAKRALDALGGHLKEIRGGTGQAFQVRNVVVDGDGTTHTRMNRTYLGLPVLGGDMVVHQKPGGAWHDLDLTLTEPPSMTAIPTLTAEAAKLALTAGNLTIFDLPKLVIEARNTSGKPRLAWQIYREGTRSKGAPSRQYVTVDALTGKVLETEEKVQTVDGTGQSLYDGTVTLGATQSGSAFELRSPNFGGTWTGDVQNMDDCPAGRRNPRNDRCTVRETTVVPPVLTDADNKWGDGTEANRQTAAVDAAYGAEMAWSYFKDVHNRNGIADDGKGSYNRVHYRLNHANASWYDPCFCMTYGDGDGGTQGPLISLDIVGHEMSHGVTSNTADLTYNDRDQGGLNESTSDIFGTMVEYYANNPNDPFDYMLGERTLKLSAGRLADRYFDRPDRDGSSFNSWSPEFNTHPSTPAAEEKYDNHATSGVGNHFFYLLSEGSGKKTINGVNYDSPTDNGVTVKGIGNYDAALIWYRALKVHMTEDTNYAGARAATLKAATELFDVDSPQYKSVADAWTAVNVK